jgi:hypothetical protein
MELASNVILTLTAEPVAKKVKIPARHATTLIIFMATYVLTNALKELI